MAYIKIVFQNSPSTATPLNAENLNHMDDQIALNDQRLTELEGAHVSSFNGRTGAVVPADNDYNIGQIAPLTGAQVGQVPVVTNIGTEEDPELVFRMGAGGGGGHSIIDSEGNTMPQETAMQFADSHVSDDETNGITIVENIKEVDPADYDSTTDEGIIVCDNGNDVPIGEIEEDAVSVTADGNTTYAQLLKDLNVDVTKLTDMSVILVGGQIFNIAYDGSEYWFTRTYIDGTTSKMSFDRLRRMSNGNWSCIKIDTSNATTDQSSLLIPQGTVISLHYGTSSGIVELNTEVSYSTAERKIGKWIDGSDLYEKTVNIGALPNATNKAVAHGITNLDKVISIEGFARRETVRLSIPYVGIVSNDGVQVYVNNSAIVITTGGDASEYSGYVTLRYTKV